MCPYKYYHVMKQSKDKKPLRYQIAQKALEIGVKPTARLFHASPSIVRIWRDRFKAEGRCDNEFDLFGHIFFLDQPTG